MTIGGRGRSGVRAASCRRTPQASPRSVAGMPRLDSPWLPNQAKAPGHHHEVAKHAKEEGSPLQGIRGTFALRRFVVKEVGFSFPCSSPGSHVGGPEVTGAGALRHPFTGFQGGQAPSLRPLRDMRVGVQPSSCIRGWHAGAPYRVNWRRKSGISQATRRSPGWVSEASSSRVRVTTA